MELMPFKSAEFDQHAAACGLGDQERDLYLAMLRAYYGRERPLCVNPDDAFGMGRLCLQLGHDHTEKRILRRLLKERFVTLPPWQFHPRLERDLPRAWQPWPHALKIIGNQLEVASLERSR